MADIELERNTTIGAPRERVHGLIDDFRAWRSWSPWEEVDPNLEREYSGAESGPGARYAWEGNRKAGKGNMEILSSTAERIEMRLVFEKPWKATHQIVFELTPADDAGTDVSWRMSGTQKGFAGLFARVFPVQRMIGRDFERGLARMKATAEGG